MRGAMGGAFATGGCEGGLSGNFEQLGMWRGCDPMHRPLSQYRVGYHWHGYQRHGAPHWWVPMVVMGLEVHHGTKGGQGGN